MGSRRVAHDLVTEQQQSPLRTNLQAVHSKIWTFVWFQPVRKWTAISVRREWHCSMSSLSYCWWSFSSTISHLLSLLQSVTLLAFSLDASPVCWLTYFTTVLSKVLYCKIKNISFIFCVCFFFMYYLCEKYYKPITVWHRISWIHRLTLVDLQIVLMNPLLESNL